MENAITNVVPLNARELLLTYASGEQRVFDTSFLLDEPVYRALRDRHLFAKVRPFYDTVEWENGIDVAPELLRAKSVTYSVWKKKTTVEHAR